MATITSRCIANFTNEHGELCEIWRNAGNRYSLYVRSDSPCVSRLTAEEMIRLLATYATRSCGDYDATRSQL